MSKFRNARCENKVNPINVDTQSPRFSWQIVSDEHDVFQTWYRIVVKNGEQTCWDSGKVESGQTFAVRYEGTPLVSREAYSWDIEAGLNTGEVLRSEEQTFETVLFAPSEWHAAFIEPDKLPGLDYDPLEVYKEKWFACVQRLLAGQDPEFFDTGEYLKSQPHQPYYPAVMMYRKFTLEEVPEKARIYMTAHGIYKFYINGKLASDAALEPEFTTYDKILKYQVYDVTALLTKGENAILVVVADGWYKGKIAYGFGCEYGDNPGLLLEMDVRLKGGKTFRLCSDETFLFSYDGPVRRADLYNGETIDGRCEIPAFATAQMSLEGWKPVHTVDADRNVLMAQTDAPVRSLMELKPKRLFVNAKGETIVDFGQNFAGHIRVEGIHAASGQEIIFEHTEELDKDETFIYPFLEDVQQQRDVYIAGGKSDECFEPTLTYHGFRYVRVTTEPALEWKESQFTGVVIGSDNEKAGAFSCSDQRLNQLQSNITWSQRSNLVGIPTDCPTREKAGWTGDVYIYGKTSCFNQNLLTFYEEWLRSVRAEQMDNGGVAYTVPQIKNYVQQLGGISTGWGDVIVELPLQLYRIYGDRSVLEQNYDAMKRWQRCLQHMAESELSPEAAQMEGRELENQRYLINTGFQFGDWLVPSVKNEQGFADGQASSFLTGHKVATTIYADTTEKLGKIAGLLGDDEEAARCEKLAGRIREAFEETYLQEDGKLSGDLQGLYILALKMRMVSDKHRSALMKRLLEKIRENNGCMDCGFMSVPHIMDVLTDNGEQEEAWKLLFQDQCPSWLYEVDRGATTMWESWNAIDENGNRDGCSFNHYAFGCVGDWMYRNILGIRAAAPGYEKITIAPDTDGPLTQAKGYYDSVHGRIALEWRREADGTVTVRGEIPANTSAVLNIRGTEEKLGNGRFEKTFH